MCRCSFQEIEKVGSGYQTAKTILTKNKLMNQETKNAILKVLDFVERYNKQDKDIEVADAAQELEDYLEYELEKGT
jgi:hypothetical protein